MAIELSPLIYDLIVGASYRAVEERMGTITVARRDFDDLRATVGELAAAQTRTEERLVRLEAAVERLAEAQARTEERVGRLEEAMVKLAEAQARTERSLNELAMAHKVLGDRVAKLIGDVLEAKYRDKAFAFFGSLLRRTRVVSLVELEDLLEAHLSPRMMRDLLPLDLLVRGRPRERKDAPEVYLAAERPL